LRPDKNRETDLPDLATKRVDVHRIQGAASRWQHGSDRVIAERAVTVMIDRVGRFTFLCTPTDLEALAVGFAFSEGIIESIEDVVSISSGRRNGDAVALGVSNPAGAGVGRNLIVASSCGMCGARNVEKVFAGIARCKSSLQVPWKVLTGVVDRLKPLQAVFRETGGAHAAGLFTADGEIVSFAEDIGRHNALDKAVGKCLLAGQSAEGCGVALSGRVSFEMVAKAARSGIELIAAVSAPSSLAVRAAAHWNMTLCGFVRAGRANVYTQPERIGRS